MPEHNTLYRMRNAAGQLLYVGITMAVEHRFRGHRHDSPWWPEVQTITLEHHPSRDAVELAELTAIRDEQPRYNRAGVTAPPSHCGPEGPRRQQVVTQVDDVLEHRRAVAIAKLRGERDLLGRGLSVVLRKAIHDYVRRHYREYRDHPDFPSELRD